MRQARIPLQGLAPALETRFMLASSKARQRMLSAVGLIVPIGCHRNGRCLVFWRLGAITRRTSPFLQVVPDAGPSRRRWTRQGMAAVSEQPDLERRHLTP